jgi:hypothetical protein
MGGGVRFVGGTHNRSNQNNITSHDITWSVGEKETLNSAQSHWGNSCYCYWPKQGYNTKMRATTIDRNNSPSTICPADSSSFCRAQTSHRLGQGRRSPPQGQFEWIAGVQLTHPLRSCLFHSGEVTHQVISVTLTAVGVVRIIERPSPPRLERLKISLLYLNLVTWPKGMYNSG